MSKLELEQKKTLIPMKGRIRIQLNDKTVVDKANTFMAVGDAHVADQLAATEHEAKMGWIAIGTSGTAFSVTSTALTKELDRNALTAGYPEQKSAGDDNDVVYKASWAAGDGTGALKEAGIFNAATVGTMLAASTFAVINKDAADTLTITWTVSCGSS